MRRIRLTSLEYAKYLELLQTMDQRDAYNFIRDQRQKRKTREYYATQKAKMLAIKKAIEEDPNLIEKLQAQLQKENEEKQRRFEEEKLRRERLQRMPVCSFLPELDHSQIRGLVALRTWDYTSQGKLKSTAMSYFWKDVNISNKIPTDTNMNGLYTIKLDEEGLMTRANTYSFYHASNVCGLIELRGIIKEHSDSVLRAEWAKIICIFLNAHSSPEPLESQIRALRENYIAPIFAITPKQLSQILFREVIFNQMRNFF